MKTAMECKEKGFQQRVEPSEEMIQYALLVLLGSLEDKGCLLAGFEIPTVHAH
jgi:hypothetical protein